MFNYSDQDICNLLNVEKIRGFEKASENLLLVESSGKYTLVAVNDVQLKKVGEVKGIYCCTSDVEPISKNVYCVDWAVRRQLGCENSYLTINTQGIKDGIAVSELPAVFDYLKKHDDRAGLRGQLVSQWPEQVLKGASKGMFSCDEIITCLDNTDNELFLCKGILLLKDAYQSEYESVGDRRALRAKLFEIINDGEKNRVSVDEGNLKRLAGVSLGELEGEQKKSVQLALEAYDFSLSDLAWINDKKRNEPATALLTEKYREIYGGDVVDGIVSRADEIVKLPYQRMFFDSLEDKYSNSEEANFLDEFTHRIKALAQTKYNEKNEYSCLDNQSANPAFREDANGIWNDMFAEAGKYALPWYNTHNNAYVREMFPEQAEQLHQFVGSHSFADRLDAYITHYAKIGKMQQVIKEYCKDNNCYLNGELHFDLVRAGVESKKEAKRCLDIWNSANDRPDRYDSPYNHYDIAEISKIAKSQVMQGWMFPVMMRAMEKGGFDFNQERMPSERTLFDCCKVWKICPEMPQRLAKQVGKHSLYGRMLAGAVFDKMMTDGKTSTEEWRSNKHLHVKFYEELSRAEKMKRSDALKQYIPNTMVNRKRLTGAGLEEKRMENTPENFKELYCHLRDEKVFDNMLAKRKEARTTFSSRLMVEAARLKMAKGR